MRKATWPAPFSDEYIFFGGKRIARRIVSSGVVHYYFADHLGSSRIVTNSSGGILEDSDFYPFGGERVVVDSADNRYKFTGKERDPESGLDYFGARYYASLTGRFLSPDEFTGGPVDAFSASDPLPPGPLPYADITNPQSLNKYTYTYTYTYNNPIIYTDPSGHCPECIGAILGAGAGGAVILYKTYQATQGKGKIPDNQEIARTLLTGAVIGASLGTAYRESESGTKQKAPTSEEDVHEITIDGKRHPESARHAQDAQDAGHPDVVTIDRSGAGQNRRDALKGTSPVPQKDRDEYPPAFSKEGGSGASVKPIPPSDNRGAGASMGQQTRGIPDGSKVRIVPKNAPKEKDD